MFCILCSFQVIIAWPWVEKKFSYNNPVPLFFTIPQVLDVYPSQGNCWVKGRTLLKALIYAKDHFTFFPYDWSPFTLQTFLAFLVLWSNLQNSTFAFFPCSDPMSPCCLHDCFPDLLMVYEAQLSLGGLNYSRKKKKKPLKWKNVNFLSQIPEGNLL